MWDSRKRNLVKALAVLGVFLFMGVAKAKAFWFGVAAIAGSIFGIKLFGGDLLEGVAVQIAEGIGNLLVYVIQALGSVLFTAVTGFLELSMELNSYIQDSPIVHDGFWVSLTIANLGLVVGILVIALATMVRADWLVDPRTSIPKFIAAALLINFGLFIGTNLVIKPVDSITQTIFNATNLSSNSFVGIFKPNLGVDAQLRAQMNIAKLPADEADSPLIAERIVNYYLLREGQLAPKIDQALRDHENAEFFNSAYAPIGQTPDNKTIYVPDAARRAVKEEVLRHTDRMLAYQSEDREEEGSGIGMGGNFLDILNPILYGNEEGYKGTIKKALSVGNAPYAFYAINPSILDDLVNSINETIKGEIDLNKNLPLIQSSTGSSISSEDTQDQPIGFDCTLWESSPSQNCKDLFTAVLNATNELSGIELVSISLSEVLFYALFVFLGVFTLLTVATLMFMRYIALSILLILFPFTWLGWIFPKISGLGNIWKSWWKEFIRWLLFGPISLFFVYLAVQAAVSREKLIPLGADRLGKGTLATISASIGDMAVVIGLMIGGVIVANKMGVKGAGLFYGGLNKMRKKVGTLAKQGVKLPFTNKYSKWGMEHMKSAAGAGWAGWRARNDMTTKGRERLDELASSSNRLTAWRGRNRQGRAAPAAEIFKKQP